MNHAEVEGGVTSSFDLSLSGVSMFNEQTVTEFFQGILGPGPGQAWMLCLGRANGESSGTAIKRAFDWPAQICDMVKLAKSADEGHLDVYVNVGLFAPG